MNDAPIFLCFCDLSPWSDLISLATALHFEPHNSNRQTIELLTCGLTYPAQAPDVDHWPKHATLEEPA